MRVTRESSSHLHQSGFFLATGHAFLTRFHGDLLKQHLWTKRQSPFKLDTKVWGAWRHARERERRVKFLITSPFRYGKRESGPRMQNGRSCRSEQKSRVSLCVFIENSGRRKERGRRDTAAHRQLFLLLFFGRPISRPGHVAAKTRGGWISTFASSSSSSYMIRVPPLWWWCVHGPCCFRAQSTPIGRRQKKRTAMKTNHALSHRSRVSRGQRSWLVERFQ